MAHYLQFSPNDNPMHLTKVGNWVFTFLSDPSATWVKLAITSVIPRQQHTALQARRWIIEQTADAHIWQLQHLECYDAALQSDIYLDLNHTVALENIEQFIFECGKYDVELRHDMA